MATVGHYPVGYYWIPQFTFKVGGVATDSTMLTVKVQDPSGTETTLYGPANPSALTPTSSPLARVSAGIYRPYPGILLTSSGYWFAHASSTAGVVAAYQHEAIADPSEFSADAGVSTRALVSLPVAKDWLQHKQISWEDDLDLVRVINDVSERFQEEAGREIKPYTTNPSTRIFPVQQTGGAPNPWYVDGVYMGDLNPWRRRIRVGDLATLSEAVVQIVDDDWTTVLETVSAGNILALPAIRKAWEPIRELEFQSGVTGLSAGMRVSVNGTWGFPAVPGSVRQAVLDAIAATYDRDVTHYQQDLAAQFSGGESNVVVVGNSGGRLLSMPPETLAVAWDMRDPVLA